MKTNYRLRPEEIETETELHGLFWQFDISDFMWSASFGGICYVALTLLGAPLPSVGSIALVALTLYRFPETQDWVPEGRMYQALLDFLGNMWLRYVKKGIVWKPTKKHPNYEGLVKNVIKVVIEDKDEPIGLIQHHDKGRLAALVKGDGWSPAARDLDVQASALNMIAAKQQLAFSKRVGLSSVFHLRDYNPWNLRIFQQSALNPLVFAPPTDSEVDDPSESWATKEVQRRSRFLHEVIASDQNNKGHARNPIAAEVVDVGGNVEIAKALAKLKKGGNVPMSDRVFTRSPVIRAAKLSRLEWAASGLKNARIASYREVIEFLAATSSHSLARFYDDQHSGATVAEGYQSHLPSKQIKAKPSYMVVDGTYIAIIKSVRKRGVITAASYKRLRSVLDDKKQPMIMSFAKLGVSSSARLEQAWLTRWLALRDILVGQFMTAQSTASRLRREEEEEREGSLGLNQNRTHNYNIVAAVFAPNYETMENWFTYLHDAFVGANMTPRQITGELSLLRYWRSLTGANHA